MTALAHKTSPTYSLLNGNTRILSILNNKGGVGKTITSMTLASILGQRGYQVLVIDLDHQRNTTRLSGELEVGYDEDRKSIYDIFFNKASIADTVITTKYPNLDIIPSSSTFINAISTLVLDSNNGPLLYRIKSALKKSPKHYDFIIIDCPSTVDAIVLNALVIATDVIIPAQPTLFSDDGFEPVLEFIANNEEWLENYNGFKILITMYQKTTNLSSAFEDDLEKRGLSPFVFKVNIPQTVKIEYAVNQRNTINYTNPTSPAAIAYNDVVDELLFGRKDDK